MDKDEVIQELARDLSITKLALADVIVNYERSDYYKSWTAICERSLVNSAQMQEAEWTAVKNSIIHSLETRKTKDAIQALALLRSEKSEYLRNRSVYRSMRRLRGVKSGEVLDAAYHRVLKAYAPHLEFNQDIDLHGARRGRIARFVETAGEWKARIFRRAHAKKH